MNTKLLGRWGEAAALDFLRKKGYLPVAAGYRTRFGEIDLIVKDRTYIVFAEVKLRKSGSFAQPREFVYAGKQERLKKTASIWIAQHETELQPRFDVIEIYAPLGTDTKNPTITHIENAF